MDRSSGILLSISSLPSPYGIGTLGKAAYEFVDFLAEAKQGWWQILPVGPTSMGDSPYQSFSAFAGNPYFIDPDLLIRDGLLKAEEVQTVFWGGDPGYTDYGVLYQERLPLLEKAFRRGWDRDRDEVRRFEEENAAWLPDYALFMALKRHFGMRSWQEWPDEDCRFRRQEALAGYREKLQDTIHLFVYLQYLFFKQWKALRAYAQEKQVRILGDMALYMALDSADVWAAPENFQLNEKHEPEAVAGVPPDYFAEGGQLWGNPLYDYAYMKQDGFGWWIRRIEGAKKLYDALRIDHFRGLESYWAVPAGEKTAKNGRWVKGPGMELLQVLKDRFPGLQFIAEDLGYPTPEVAQLLKDSGFPGMKVLEFSFDSRDDSSSLPYAYGRNCICYSGTHDNETLGGWLTTALPEDLEKTKRYLGLNKEEGYIRGMLRGGMSTAADLFIAQMQDYLGLGIEARMNEPGTTSGNWRWRMRPGQITGELAEQIAEMTSLYGRN